MTTMDAGSDNNCVTTSEYKIRPFEWLTSAESLRAALQEVVEGKENARVLHIGCGSSILGEFLLDAFPHKVAQVVNVDNDANILQTMEKRWIDKHCQSNNNDEVDKMKFVLVDICNEDIPFENGSFDIVLDKSTLDCLLCSDKGASSLITQVHRLLDPLSGVYLMISFHHIDFLRPLLEDCPGADWKVSHSVMYRHVEDFMGGGKTITNLADVEVPLPQARSSSSPSVWTSGGFQPDEIYHRTVNILLCRKQGGQKASSLAPQLDFTIVYEHVNKCSDEWYRKQNPMLTPERIQQLQARFDSRTLDLAECYQVLFTEDEREHLSFEAFMDDWKVFLQSHSGLNSEEESMSCDTALRFLAEMQ